MKQKLDKAWLGLLTGILIPCLCGYVFLLTNGIVGYTVAEMLWLMSSDSMIIKLLCVSIFPNMAGVFLLNTLEMWHACKGMFASIFIYVAVCLFLIFLNI